MRSFFIRFSLLMLLAALVVEIGHAEPASKKALPVQVAQSSSDQSQESEMFMEPASMWDEMDRMHQQLNQMFRSSFTRNPIQIGHTPSNNSFSRKIVSSSVDVAETADQIIVSCDVPGINKQDLKIDIRNNVLTIKGERKNEIARTDQSDEYQYHYQERSFGGFERSFVLPDEVDPNSAVAEHKNGVLTVRMNKLEGKAPISVPIQ